MSVKHRLACVVMTFSFVLISQFPAKSDQNLFLAAFFDNRVQVIGTNYTASDKFRYARYHAGELGGTLRKRHQSNQFVTIMCR